MAPRSNKKRTHRQRKQRAGGWGFTGQGSIPGTPGTVSNPMVYTGIGDCRAVQPGYAIPTSAYGASFKGLPGMSGGKRRGTRKGRKGTRKQRGGRYGFFPEGDPNPSGQAWWAGSYAPFQRIACEGTTQNPLNPVHTGSSAPPGAANPNYYLKGGAQLAPAGYGVGNVDSMYYYAPTAGYANTASTWKDSVGAPVQIQVPFAARAMNQACLTTGGTAPLTGALQKGGKRKNRKNRTKKGGGLLGDMFSGLLGKPKNNSLNAKMGNTYGALNSAEKPTEGVEEGVEVPPLANNTASNTGLTNVSLNNTSSVTSTASNPNALVGGRKRSKKSKKSRKHRKHH